MVKATGKLRTFDVELRQQGCDPRLVATDVSIDEARSMCRELVGPSAHAVVRPRKDEGTAVAVELPKYSIWLWNDSKLRWERIQRRQEMTLEQATNWLQQCKATLRDRLTLVAPAHLANPAEMLRHAK
ncbi:hypothetical protein SH139x_000439 [Planctomycetaceae bacterium SH139]